MTRWLSAGERGTLPRKRADDSRSTSAPDRMKQPKIDQYRNVSIVQYDEFVILIMISAQSDDTGMFVSTLCVTSVSYSCCLIVTVAVS